MKKRKAPLLKIFGDGSDRNKGRFKNWKLCVLWKLQFRHHGAIKLTQNCVCFTNPCINPLFRLPSLVNTTPRYLNVSTCCSVFLLTCREHCLGRHERHNTSIFSELILVASWSHAAENRSNECWRPRCEDPRMQHQFVRKKQTVHPADTNSDTLVDTSVSVYPSSYRPGLFKIFGREHISYCATVWGHSSCVMCFFGDMLHSTKSTHFS